MSDQINSRSERRKAAERESKRNKKPIKKSGLIKKLLLAVVMIGLAILVGGGGLFAYYASSAPKLDEELLKDPLSSDILDANQNVILKTGTEKREYVPYDQIPKAMEDAILATEDVRFYSHHGMDFYRLGGAVLANFRSGFGSQGASTLTQQVIKNSFFKKNDKTLKRKAQEAWLAFQLERTYDKEEIFEIYFNKILMGGNKYGVGTASQFFYGKDLNQLELHEMALLAGIPQSPNGYNPFTNPERAEKRRNIVLGLMVQHKKITQAEADAAKAIPVTSTLQSEEQRQANDNTKYPAFIDLVYDELDEAGLLDLLTEGVTIHTTLDPVAQDSVEAALASNVFANDKMQAALTVLDTKTGAIVAVGGGRGFSTGGLNFAIKDNRQPGSAIKPILSYAPAIEYLNWSTGQTIHDTAYNYEGSNPPQPVRNIDRQYRGAISIREALYDSRNVPAVKTYEAVGRKKAVDFAAQLGVPFENDYPSNALGGSEEFSTLQLAGAYAPFGNGGYYTKPHAIKKIVYRDGHTTENRTPDSVVVMKDSTAYMVTDILRDVLSKGTGKRAAISGLDIAGKTGTTNFADKNGAKDVWFSGYTTNYTVAVWAGYQDRSPMNHYEGERFVPQDLFKKVMGSISTGKETAQFKKPGSVEEAVIHYGSDPFALASASTPDYLRRAELFVKGTLPAVTEEVEEEIILEAPTDLTADYNADSASVELSWSHNEPDSDEIEGDVQFILSVSSDGEMQEITRTYDDSAVFTRVELGKTYTFNVVATINDLVSSPASITIQIAPPEDFEEPEELEEPEVPDIDDNDNNNQNNNNQNNPPNKDKDKDQTPGKEEDPIPPLDDEEIIAP